jgi:glucosamine--fructose-6-phosphate aminotransferase (isomerizing)
MGTATTTRGGNTLSELLSEPQCWTQCLEALRKSGEIEDALKQLPARSDWLFIGCGSSFYVAQAAASSWTALTGQRARAVPASELLLFPGLVLSGESSQPVLISRSGHTSEVLKVAEYLESEENLRTLAITCTDGQQLEKISTATLHLLPADEQSMVMTRSFTSMVLGLQDLAATVGKQHAFLESLLKLPALAQTALDPLPSRVQQFVDGHAFADYVFLGQGPFYGVASESMLKVTEMSCSYAQVFHTLEFRHGPKSIVSPETLVSFLLSESGYEAECEVLEEVKGLGGTTLVVANTADSRARRSADFLVELNLGVPEYARLTSYVLTGQLLGLFTGLKKGLDPDCPPNLSRAVVLNAGR